MGELLRVMGASLGSSFLVVWVMLIIWSGGDVELERMVMGRSRSQLK